MRYLFGVVVANIIFQLVLVTMTVAFVFLKGGSMDIMGFATSFIVTTCAATTLLGLCFMTVITDPPLLGWAQRRTSDVTIQYAIAYTVLVLGVAGLFFVPFAVFTSPPIIVIVTLSIAAISAFAGGSVRGLSVKNAGRVSVGFEVFA